MGISLSKYYLGATIVNPEVIARVQEFTNTVNELLGHVATVIKEAHITIIPPFYADYETASRINLACSLSTLLSTHPLTTTLFSIRGLGMMSFDGFDVLHFPVAIHQEASSEQRFTDYVVATRRKVIALGTHFKGAIPEKFTPHITVITDRRLSENPHLQACVEKSLACDPVIFRSGYPSLYARYPEGWNDLSRDPSLFTE